jgi:LacI family transcriptional regulator
MCFNDLIALGALMAIHESNLRCPEDVSLFGFDGLDLTETTTPQISSVYQSPYQMGAEGANLVLERLKNQMAAPHKIVLKTELRVRDSVGPAPQPVNGKEQLTALRAVVPVTT